MKNLFIMLAGLSILSSCGEAPEEIIEIEQSTYTLNTEESILNWHGEESPEHFQEGSITFTEGSMVLEEDKIISGNFSIDLQSINPSTEGYPVEKMEYLKSHLLDTSFFFSAEHPTMHIVTGEYKDGKLLTTINVRGIDVTTEVPLKVEMNEGSLTISGDFSIDLAPAKIPYLTEPDPETGVPGAKSTVDFNIHLQLNL